jgi:endo-1,4-beta-xylanase
LKNYANNIKIGVAANTMKFNNASYNEALKAFNYMDAENGCKLASIQPRKGVYNFNDCDDHYNRAKQLGMVFRGHCLIWYSDQPDWFKYADANTLKNSIVDHITKTLQHYNGKADGWDVVNEAIDDGSSSNGWRMRNSFLYQKVPNFIDLA